MSEIDPTKSVPVISVHIGLLGKVFVVPAIFINFPFLRPINRFD